MSSLIPLEGHGNRLMVVAHIANEGHHGPLNKHPRTDALRTTNIVDAGLLSPGAEPRMKRSSVNVNKTRGTHGL